MANIVVRGRYQKQHGLATHPLYHVRRHMILRCTEPSHPAFARYGGRGIEVCEQWMGPTGLKQFIADMWPRPDGYTLERTDNDGPYSPENCRWATYAEQNRNTSYNRMIEFKGETMCIHDWAVRIGISDGTISRRLLLGLPLDVVLCADRLPRRSIKNAGYRQSV